MLCLEAFAFSADSEGTVGFKKRSLRVFVNRKEPAFTSRVGSCSLRMFSLQPESVFYSNDTLQPHEADHRPAPEATQGPSRSCDLTLVSNSG